MFEEKGRFAEEQGRERLYVITGQSFTRVITVNDLISKYVLKSVSIFFLGI